MHTRRMTRPPPRFSGTLEEFYERYVVPNLSSPEMVTHCHRLLIDYVATPHPLFLIRYGRGMKRPQVYFTDRGERAGVVDASLALSGDPAGL
jgi:hypothetical protein